MPNRFACLLVALAFAPAAAAESADASALLRRAAEAMGAEGLNSIRYSGSGMAASFGQAFKPGDPWPKLNVPSFTRLINYETSAMREERVQSRAEPRGGGAVPLSGEQKVSFAVAGTHAWNQAGPAPTAAPVAVTGRLHDLWTTPHGAIRAAQRNAARVAWRTEKGRELAAVSFTEPGRFSATVLINDQYLVERVESRLPSTVLGDVASVIAYSDYRHFGNVRFPGRIVQTIAGSMVLDLQVKEVEGNAKTDIGVPEPVRAFAERVAVEKAADGVWYLAGGSHHSVAIEMQDHLVVVESPLYDGRAGAMLEAASKLVPGKPVRYVVSSHSHFDHAGGLRTAVAHGATIVAHAGARGYYEKAFANPSRIAPDALTKSKRKAKVIGAGAKHVMKDATRTIELHHITGGPHVATFLMAYLPKEKLLVEADAYTPLAPNAAPPSPANANNVNLIENIERLKLQVDRILPLHGRIVPVDELYRTAGRKR